MSIVNKKGYVKTRIGRRRHGCRAIYKNFWIGRKQIKFDVCFPRIYWGKKIRIKIELVKPSGMI